MARLIGFLLFASVMAYMCSFQAENVANTIHDRQSVIDAKINSSLD